MFKIQKFYKKICTLFVIFCVAGQLWAEEEAVKQDFTENQELKAATAQSKLLALQHGFAPATLVKTPSGYSEIGALKVGDPVICVDSLGQIAQSKVTATRRFIATKTICLSVEQEIIITNLSQPFFCHGIAKLVNIEALSLSSKLQSLQATMPEIQSLWVQQLTTELVAISIELHQNYCVTNADIVVHNLAPAIATYAALDVATGVMVWLSLEFYHWLRNPQQQAIAANLEHRLEQQYNREKSTARFDFASIPAIVPEPSSISFEQLCPTPGDTLHGAANFICGWVAARDAQQRIRNKLMLAKTLIVESRGPVDFVRYNNSRKLFNVFDARTIDSNAQHSIVMVLSPDGQMNQLVMLNGLARNIFQLITRERLPYLLKNNVEHAELSTYLLNRDVLKITQYIPELNLNRNDYIFLHSTHKTREQVFRELKRLKFLEKTTRSREVIVTLLENFTPKFIKFRPVGSPHGQYEMNPNTGQSHGVLMSVYEPNYNTKKLTKRWDYLLHVKNENDLMKNLLENNVQIDETKEINVHAHATANIDKYGIKNGDYIFMTLLGAIYTDEKSSLKVTAAPEITPPTKPTGCGDVTAADEAGQIGCALVPEQTPDFDGNTGCGSAETLNEPEHTLCARVPAKNPDLDRTPGCGTVDDFKLDDTVMAKSKHGDRPRNAKQKKDLEKPQSEKAQEVGNMEDLVKNTVPGKILAGKIEKIPRLYAGHGNAPVYEVLEDIPELKLKKGYCFYLDRLHKNEIEVFPDANDGTLQKLIIDTNGKITELNEKEAKKKERYFRRAK